MPSLLLRSRTTRRWRLSVVLVLVASCGPGFDLKIEAVSPSDTATGIATPLTLTGSGFESGARLHLTGPGGSPLVLDAEVSDSGDEARFLVPAGLLAGSYDVGLSNPGGEIDTVDGGFTVYEGGIEITFLDVDQGDSTFIRSPRGDTLLMDGGIPNMGKDVVVPFLSRRGALPPTNVISSHRHDDHIGGIVVILEGPDGIAGTSDDRLPSGLLLHNEPANTCNSVICNRYDAASRNRARAAELGEVIDLGAGVRATVVAVSGKLLGGFEIRPDDENSASVAIVIEFGDLRIFVGGDLSGGGFNTVDMETPLSASIAPIHVLRVNHHGSGTSTNIAFAHSLSPAAAVISAGRNNSYCHPHRAVLTRLETIGARTFLTTPGIVQTSDHCSETTYLPPGAMVAHGHIRLESLDGRRYSIGPIDGPAVELVVP